MSRTDRAARREMRQLGQHTTSLVRCAARYARLTGSSIHRAAQAFGIGAGGVWNAWERMYPCQPQPITQDRKPPTATFGPKRERHRGPPICSACNEVGHVAINGRCSPSETAIRLVRGGCSVQDAADRVGITNQSVYAALQNRRKAA